ncbi:MAG: methyltransferase domain-containing protein, partial [Thermogutta sp.]|nr:methyltransferase domain-containing protein [Thermogutta sp.]
MLDVAETKAWLMEVSDGFRQACILGAAVELGIFDALSPRGDSAAELARRTETDLRALTILLDALAAIQVLKKEGDRYRVTDAIRACLSDRSPVTTAPMIRHRMNVMRGWVQLAWTVKSGIPAPKPSGIRGPAADLADFILAMESASRDVADALVADLLPLEFRTLLDVGGGPGTWTFAFLRALPHARAIYFDLPHAAAQAERLAGQNGFRDRIRFVTGDFYVDPLPDGADFAWVSAIAHQNSREQNRALFRKVFEALAPGGKIAIRDVVLEPSRTAPFEGALFAVNMLANTPKGSTYTLAEYQEDLEAAGFREPSLRLRSEAMNSVILA